jgi:peroxiredoxin
MHAKPTLWFALILVAGFALLLSELQNSTLPIASPRVATDAASSVDAVPVETDLNQVMALGLADATSNASVLTASRHPSERPLQSFSGTGLDGASLTITDFIGKRLTIFFFNPEVPEAAFAAVAVARISAYQGKNNFNIVGVAIRSKRFTAKAFAEGKGLDFPIFDDSNGRIAAKLGLQSPVGIYGFDDESYFEFGIGYFNKDAPDPENIVEDQLRKKLRLPPRTDEAAGVLDTRPVAPMFTTSQLNHSEPFDFASLSGKPVILMFFLHTCPHCHAALDFFKEQLAKLPADKRPTIVAISAANRPSAVRTMLRERKLEDMDMQLLLDPDSDVMEKYGVFGGFPDILLIDSAGKIAHRTQGWREDRDPALNRMLLAKIAGTRIPMLLNRRGYTGSDVCSVCHELEAQTYRFTQHADAYNTIVTHNKTRNAECVSCHVVGFDKPGGYSFAETPTHLENVGCESCHGRGGPHLSPDFVPKVDGAKHFESICQTCHNATHSISFDYATFRPKISHVGILGLSNSERSALVSDSAKPRDVLPKNADYVGSSACQSCHPSEYKSWAGGPHRHAVDTLEIKGKADDANCLKCHTTGMGRPGGFPKAGKGSDRSHGDLASVGCESCHGPGGNHIAPAAKKLGTIVSLADKCDSCAILQICGSCHDQENDPGFEFEVEAKIELQRHGTIEAGSGKPLSGKPTARLSNPNATPHEDVARVLRMIDTSS